MTLPRGVAVDGELVDDAVVLGVQEAHRQQDEVGLELVLGALDAAANGGAASACAPVERAHAAVLGAQEARRDDGEVLLAAPSASASSIA